MLKGGTFKGRRGIEMAVRLTRHLPAALALAGVCAGLLSAPDGARALTIELKDVAADRMERQRSFNEGALPLPGTPNVAIFDQRLKDIGVSLGAPMLIRVFKTESEMEVWKEKDGQMVLFATYPICHWSGTLGPKLKEGDKQAPEGFYTVTKKQLRHAGRWPRSLLLNFPNAFDQGLARTGSDILIHGGCTSVGCFAMTNPVSDEIHRMATASIDAGQEHLPIHVFPFRMTQENLRTHQSAAWQGFWGNLKEGYDYFERTKRPPRVSTCEGRYVFADAGSPAATGPMEACQTAVASANDADDWLNGVPPPPVPAGAAPVRTAAADLGRMHLGAPQASDATAAAPDSLAALTDPAATQAAAAPSAPVFRCRWALRVCRKTATLKDLQLARRAVQFAGSLRQFLPPPPARAASR